MWSITSAFPCCMLAKAKLIDWSAQVKSWPILIYKIVNITCRGNYQAVKLSEWQLLGRWLASQSWFWLMSRLARLTLELAISSWKSCIESTSKAIRLWWWPIMPRWQLMLIELSLWAMAKLSVMLIIIQVRKRAIQRSRRLTINLPANLIFVRKLRWGSD